MTEKEEETQIHTINLFVDEILADINRVDMSTRKSDMLAHMDYWKTTLNTIKFMMKTDGII